MQKIELQIIALSHSLAQSTNFAVVLGEKNGQRRLPIVIGGFEAQAIALALENLKPNRPLTHDLFKNTLEQFNIKLKEVVISNLQEGVFFARLICHSDGRLIEVDSRTSDAIAMAVRFQCPIYTYANILESAGLTMEAADASKAEDMAASMEMKTMETNYPNLEALSQDDLLEKLNEVLAEEDYETAARIRDELNRRQK